MSNKDTVFKNAGLFFLILLLLLNVAFIAYAIVDYYRTIHSEGSIVAVNVEVFWDPELSNNASQTNLEWGDMIPGESKTVSLYVVNYGNRLMNLSLSMENFDPWQAQGNFTLTWNLENVILHPYDMSTPHEVLEAQITLTVRKDIRGVNDFNFDIVVIGTDEGPPRLG